MMFPCHPSSGFEWGEALLLTLIRRTTSQVGEGFDGSFVDSFLEQLALENPKVASQRGALGLRKQVKPLP